MKSTTLWAGRATSGFPIRLAVGLGVLELACVALNLFPRTAIPGAILPTGYLGGAVAMQLRVGNPLFAETPVVEGFSQAAFPACWSGRGSSSGTGAHRIPAVVSDSSVSASHRRRDTPRPL